MSSPATNIQALAVGAGRRLDRSVKRLAALAARFVVALASVAVLLVAGWFAWSLMLFWLGVCAVLDDALWRRVRRLGGKLIRWLVPADDKAPGHLSLHPGNQEGRS